MKRTHLPLNALRVFEAAARHLSFTRAADELAVTPAAVGQQVRALEETLGVVLFRRTARGLELTPEAAESLNPLRAGFLNLEDAVRAMQVGQASAVLTLAAPPAALAKWLLPRLITYADANPGLDLRIQAIRGAVDFTEANLDLALTWGDPPDAEGVHGKTLGDETLTIIAAPSRAGQVRAAADLCTQTLLDSPDSAWGDWFAAHDLTPGAVRLALPDAGLALDAAVASAGVARVPGRLAADAIEAGQVAELFAPMPVAQAYWLSAPAPQWRQAKVRQLVAALTQAP